MAVIQRTFKLLRSTTPGASPRADQGFEDGEIYFNLPDNTIGIMMGGQPNMVFSPSYLMGGFVNKLRNGTFDIWQRGPGPFPVGLTAGWEWMTADGWSVSGQPNGAFVDVSPGDPIGGCARSMRVAARASPVPSEVRIYHRIEAGPSGMAANESAATGGVAKLIAGQRCTLQFMFRNVANGPANNPVVKRGYPTTNPDSWTAGSLGTQDGANLTGAATIEPGETKVIAYTFDIRPAATPITASGPQLGYTIEISLPMVANGVFEIGAADLRPTPGWPLGVCANPPPPELRPIAQELQYCMRYFQAGEINSLLMPWHSTTWNQIGQTSTTLSAPMRIANPSVQFRDLDDVPVQSTVLTPGGIVVGAITGVVTIATTDYSPARSVYWRAHASTPLLAPIPNVIAVQFKYRLRSEVISVHNSAQYW